MKILKVSTTSKNEIVDITDDVKGVVEKSGIKEGLCHVYVPHATAAIIINENYDPNVMTDILKHLSETIADGRWLHDRVDGNGAAHIKSALVGPGEVIPISGGKLALGTWQDIMLCDFDGPRERDIYVTMVKSN